LACSYGGARKLSTFGVFLNQKLCKKLVERDNKTSIAQHIFKKLPTIFQRMIFHDTNQEKNESVAFYVDESGTTKS